MTPNGLLPPLNDIFAVVVIMAAYLLRFAVAGSPTQTAPIWLIVTTDLILPTMAGAYLFVLAIFITIERYDQR